MAKEKTKNKKKDSSEILEDLIFDHYEKLKKSENVKVGDLIKMIELQRKQTPADSNQKQFWKMIDEVRKNNLDSKDKPSDKPKRKNEKK